MKIYALPLLLLPFSALAEGERLPYICDNGSSIDISFSVDLSGRPQAILHFSDAAITLPQVPSASGVLYRAEEIRLHTKADEAIFEDGKGNVRRCKQGSAIPVTEASAPVAASSFIDITGRIFYFSRVAQIIPNILRIQIIISSLRALERMHVCILHVRIKFFICEGALYRVITIKNLCR